MPNGGKMGGSLMGRTLLILVIELAATGAGFAMELPSRPDVDAPQLAPLGRYAVGVRTITLVQHDQPDVLAFDASTGIAPRRDRTLIVDIWYPAVPAAHARAETYHASMPAEPPSPPISFSIPGLAVRNAPPAGGQYPLVVASHGDSDVTVTLSWLTENLASKGYVVAAIRHQDPDISDRSKFAQPVLRRPLDIAFVAAELQRSLAAEGLIDPTRTALFGHSTGGYSRAPSSTRPSTRNAIC
jgi:predicted dienelactone hydrolase